MSYISNNDVTTDSLSKLIQYVHATLSAAGGETQVLAANPPQPPCLSKNLFQMSVLFVWKTAEN